MQTKHLESQSYSMKGYSGVSDNDASPHQLKQCAINCYDIAFYSCELINCEGHPTTILLMYLTIMANNVKHEIHAFNILKYLF